MKQLIILFITTCSLFSQSFVKEYTYHASDDDSKTSARKAALSHVKMLAIEEVGVTIRSSFHNYVDVEDEKVKKVINSKIDTVAQNVTHSRILKESWNGVVFYIKAEISIDPKEVGREIRKTVAKELHAINEKKIVKQVSKPKLIAAPVVQTVPVYKTITIAPIKTRQNKEVLPFPLSRLNYQYTTKREEKFTPWMSQEVYQAEYTNGMYKNNYPAYIETNEFGERRVLKLESISHMKYSSKSARSLKYIQDYNVKKMMEGKRMLSLHVNYIGSQAFYSAVWVKQSVYNRERRRLEEYGISFNEPIIKPTSKRLDLNSAQSSHLNSFHKYERENAFSSWISAAKWQKLFSSGYFIDNKLVPIYTEINEYGERRYIQIDYEPSYYWVIYTGKTFSVFKKQHTKQMMEGKRLLTLHISEVDSQKFYTGVWVSANSYERERKKLEKFGIYPPTSD